MLQRLFKRSSKTSPRSLQKSPVAFGAESMDLRPVSEIGSGAILPVYPERSHAVPAYTPDELLATQAPLIQQLQLASDLDRDDFSRLVMPALRNFAAYVHLLPASEAHHHFGLGGLLRHGLEVSYYATTFCYKAMLGYEHDPERSYGTRKRWRLAVLFGALLHDMGKPIVDVGALTPDGDAWSPHDSSLHAWLVSNGLDHYHIQWRPGGRHKAHEAFNAVSTYRILPEDTIRYLCEYGQEPFDTMILALSGRPDMRYRLAEYIRDADSKSVEIDLKNNKVNLASAGRGAVANLASRLLFTMHGLIESGEWRSNRPSAPLWITDQGTYLLFPTALQEVHDRLRDDPSVTSLPRDLNALLDALIDHKRVLTNRVSQSHETRTWNIRLTTTEKGREFCFDTMAIRWADDDLVPKTHVIVAEATCEILGPDGQPMSNGATYRAEDVLAAADAGVPIGAADAPPADDGPPPMDPDEEGTLIRMLEQRAASKRAALDFHGPDPSLSPESAPPLRDRAAEPDPADARIQIAEEAYNDPFPPTNAEDATRYLNRPEFSPWGSHLYDIAAATKSDVRLRNKPGSVASGLLAGRDVFDLNGRVHMSVVCFALLSADIDTVIGALDGLGWLDNRGLSGTARTYVEKIDGQHIACIRLSHEMSSLMRLFLPHQIGASAFRELDKVRDATKPVVALGPHIPGPVFRAMKNPTTPVPEDEPIARAAFFLFLQKEHPQWRDEIAALNPHELLATFNKQHPQRGRLKNYFLTQTTATSNPIVVAQNPKATPPYLIDTPLRLRADYDPTHDMAIYDGHLKDNAA